MIKFLFNHQAVCLDAVASELTVLEYVRHTMLQKGSKEGCASGDCGACTMVIAEVVDNTIRYRSMNACITFMAALHGKQLLTVEHLACAGKLHPVQQAMVDCHGSQCGFCTPGFIMSLYALWQHRPKPSHAEIEQALGGNLCRCTGYRSIIASVDQWNEQANEHRIAARGNQQALIQQLKALQEESEATTPVASHPPALPQNSVFLPKSITAVANLLQQYPAAHLVAGSTDLALSVTQQLKPLAFTIHLSQVTELRQISVDEEAITIGAACPYTDCLPILQRHFPAFANIVLRLGSTQIRNQGTFGGNLGTASPIGDTLPALLALNASLILRQGETERELAVDDFFLGYRKTALQAGEFIRAIRIPRLQAGQQLFMEKVSKRLDDDISAICVAWCLTLKDGKVIVARSGYGGMAAVPARAKQTEQALLGKPLNAKTLAQAQLALDQDFTPMSDVRASKWYRMTVAKRLLETFA